MEGTENIRNSIVICLMVVIVINKDDCIFKSKNLRTTFAMVSGAYPPRPRPLTVGLFIEPVFTDLNYRLTVPGKSEHGPCGKKAYIKNQQNSKLCQILRNFCLKDIDHYA